MSSEDDSSNNSDYDEDSFENESIEEELDDDESIPEKENDVDGGSSMDDLLTENDIDDSLNGGPDKHSHEEIDKDLSILDSDENDIEVSEFVDSQQNKVPPYMGKQYEALTEVLVNEHEIEESDSADSEVQIIKDVKTLAIDTQETLCDKKTTDDIKHNSVECEDDLSQNETDVEFNITSQTPTSFNSENHAFHMDIIPKATRSNGSIHQHQRSTKSSNRKSLSFSNERMREIERHNQILLKKILSQKPRKENLTGPNMRTSTSAINRKKQQRQIDLDNQVLKRKIEAISLRRHQDTY